MKNLRKFTLLVILLLVSSGLAYGTMSSDIQINQEQEEPSTKVFVTDDLTVKVPTSQVPFYYFWNTDDDTTTYRVQFDALYEAVDNNTNGQYDPDHDTVIGESMLALAQMSWDMSEIVNETNSEGNQLTHFNLTGSMIFDPSSSVVVQFNNHLITDDTGTTLKFDVLVNNYEWSEPAENTLLVLAYKLQSTDPDYEDQPNMDEPNQARFGNAYFDSVPTASNSTGEEVSSEVTASVTTGQGSSYGTSDDDDGRIYQSYTYFEGNLTHDPTIGIDQQQPEEKMFETDELTIKTPTSQVPFYFFWPTDDSESTYRVQFDAMFEVRDQNGNDQYDQDGESMVQDSVIALAQMSWQISDVVNSTQDGDTIYSFNLTGTSGSMGNPLLGDLVVQFRNHLQVGQEDTSLKFDIVVQNYDWTNDTDDTLLVLAYKLQSNDTAYDGSTEQSENSVQFGRGYFNSTSTASNSTGEEVSNEVKASLSTGDGSGTNSEDNDARIYLSYSHFDGNLTHDPTIGLSDTDTDGDDGDTTTEDTDQTSETSDGLESVALPLSFITGLAIIVAIPIIRRRRR